MKKKKIYVKNNYKVEKHKCFIYDNSLEELMINARQKGYEELSTLLKLVLCAESKTHLSYAINDLMDYYPRNNDENDIKNNCLFCIILDGNKQIDLTSMLLSLEYQFDLKTSFSEFDDDIIFSEKINNIPFESSFKVKQLNTIK